MSGVESGGSLRISVLGSPTVEVDGSPLQVDTRKATALLIYLAVTRSAQGRDHLTGLLWPDLDEERARAALRRTLSALRKALGERWVAADRFGVRLDPDGVEVDVATFDRLAQEASSHGHGATEVCPECVGPLTGAVETVKGRFLQGFGLRDADAFEEWQTIEAESIERRLHGALDRLVRARVETGDLEGAAAVAQRKLALDPLDEPAHRQLMQLYAWRGMRPQALQQYRECVAVLDRELGVAPVAETTALYESIAEGTTETAPGPELRRPSPGAAARPMRPLRGRERERDLLGSLLTGQATARLVTIEGEAGIGKTRLAQDLLDAAAREGAAVVAARAYEGEAALPYALLTQVATQLLENDEKDPAARQELGRLVPGAASGADDEVDDPGARTRFFEGVRRALVSSLAGTPPGILFLDDLQWCDGASLEVLSYVLRRMDEVPMCVVCAWRTEDVDADHPVGKITGAVSETESIRLKRLGPDTVREIVADAGIDSGNVSSIAERLHEETEGVPFFLVEYLAVMSGGPAEKWDAVPESVRDLLRRRISSVGQVSRQVLGTAAVIDRSFDFETVRRSSGRTELETLDGLDELVTHGLVSVTDGRDDALYEFTHDKLRVFVYESLGPARRRVLHRRVAESLMAQGRAQATPGTAASIARHLELGGLEERAARFHARAADDARKVFANAEALHHYQSALALGHPDVASLHEGAGDMRVLLGDYGSALESYQAAAAHAGHGSLDALEHKLGEVHLRRGDWERAQNHFGAALETLDDDDVVTRARLLSALSFSAYRQGRLDEARDLATRSLADAETSADARTVAVALNQMAILDNASHHLQAARSSLERSLSLADEVDDVAGRVAALNNLAHTERLDGNVDRALELAREALELCIEQGDSHREAALHNNIADLLHEKGETDEAMRHLKKATSTLAKIGSDTSGMLPEVWKLVEW